MSQSIGRHASLRMATKKSHQENIDPNRLASSRLTNLNKNHHHTPNKLNLTPTRSHSSLLDSPNTANIINNKNLSKLQHSASDSHLNLSINDCTCPICLEILVEPVKMPCSHELCLPCFKAMTDKTNFLCPMCRMRISTWSRSAANTNTLVDAARWAQIKAAFPREVRIRLEGKTALYLEQEMKEQDSLKKKQQHQDHLVQCSKPGEIGKEYQEYLRQEEERIRLENEKEEKLSKQLIQQVIQEEENLSINEYLQVLNSASANSLSSSSRGTSSNVASNMINYFNRIQSQQSPLEQRQQQRKTTSLVRSNTIHQAPTTSSSSSSISSEIRTNLLKKRTLNTINSAAAASSSANSDTEQPLSAMNNLRISHRNTNVTPAPTLLLEKNNQTITPQNITSTHNAPEATSPSTSIAKSVKLRPRQSIKRTRDLPATVSNLRTSARIHTYTESTMDDSIISLSSINASTSVVTAKNLRRRKINVNEHDHEDSSDNLDSSGSNVSCISDTSTMTKTSSSSLASNRLRRK